MSQPNQLQHGLRGRIAIVTGASAGIGLAVAEELAGAGASLVINARRAEKLSQVAQKINQMVGSGPDSPRCVPIAGDCADPAVIDRLLHEARQRFTFGEREADLVVVNAGRGLDGSLLTSDPQQWAEVFRTNVAGAALLMRSAAERMLESGPEPPSGRTPEDGESHPTSVMGDPRSWLNTPRDIVVIGSVVGRHISPFSSLYGGSKFAVHSYTEALRREVGPRGIRVTLIEPGIVRSEFQQVAGYDPEAFGGIMSRFGPVLEPEDVARAIGFCVSQPAAVHIGDLVIRGTRQDYP